MFVNANIGLAFRHKIKIIIQKVIFSIFIFVVPKYSLRPMI